MQIVPVLPSQNIDRDIAWYNNKVDFKLVQKDSMYAVLKRDNIYIHLQWHADTENDPLLGGSVIKFFVEDIQPFFEEFVKRETISHDKLQLKTAWNTNEFFWDGRAHLLRDQSLGPIENPVEMNETLGNVVNKLSAMPMYKNQFFRAFNSEEITSLKMSLALEQFMHSIVSHNSKFDKSQRLEVALTPSERRGRVLFFQEFNGPVPSASGADCAHCHSGSNFENDLYMNNGLDTDATISDSGRYAATGINGDIGKFKVPTLRNIELTPPYMHDGRFKTLEEVVDHYDHGIKVSTTLDPALNSTITTGLRLTAQDKIDLVAFLKTLTDEDLISDKRYSSPF